jgi:hypothetical protein
MAMPRFFFHLNDQDGIAVEHRDFGDARMNAVRLLGEQLSRTPERFDNDAYWRMEVASADGLTLTVFHVSEVSAPAAGRKPKV